MNKDQAKWREQLGTLANALENDRDPVLSCEECEAHLPAYIEAELEGEKLATRFPAVCRHLLLCDDCGALYADLLEVSILEEAGQLPAPTTIPIPDLSFLRARTSTPPRPLEVDWQLDKLGRLIIAFSAELLRTLQSLAYQPAYASAGLKSDKSQRVLCQLSLKEAVKDLEVTITAEERRDDPTTCTVIVEVNVPNRGGWPNLAGTEVALKRDEIELEMQLTDAFGKVTFEGIRIDDLPHLVFEIIPAQEP